MRIVSELLNVDNSSVSFFENLFSLGEISVPHIFFNNLKHVIPFFKLIFGWAEIVLAQHGLCLVAASRDYSSLLCMDSHCGGFSCCEAQALGTRASAVAAHGL